MSEATSLQWQDVLRERDDALARVVELERELKGVRMLLRCEHKVEIEGTRGIAHTYCQRPLGHEGKCAVELTEEDKKEKTNDPA